MGPGVSEMAFRSDIMNRYTGCGAPSPPGADGNRAVSAGLKAPARFVCMLLLLSGISCSLHMPGLSERKGDRETVIVREWGLAAYRVEYSFVNDMIVRGECWQPGSIEGKTNRLRKTRIAAAMAAELKRTNPAEEFPVDLGTRRDGFSLKFVRMVKYNVKSLPALIIDRGSRDGPEDGRFLVKTNTSFSYNAEGLLVRVVRRSLSVDSMLLNGGDLTITLIERDGRGRPVSVVKTIGHSRMKERTVYFYEGLSDEVVKTEYRRAGYDPKFRRLINREIIIVTYRAGVLWKNVNSGDLLERAAGISVFDTVKRKYLVKTGDLRSEEGTARQYVESRMAGEANPDEWTIGQRPYPPDPYRSEKTRYWWQN